jgi:hypothetical protein
MVATASLIDRFRRDDTGHLGDVEYLGEDGAKIVEPGSIRTARR